MAPGKFLAGSGSVWVALHCAGVMQAATDAVLRSLKTIGLIGGFIIIFTILFCNLTNSLAWISHCYNIIWNIFSNHTSRTYNNIISNVNSRIYYNTSSYPNIISYCYSNAILIT